MKPFKNRNPKTWSLGLLCILVLAGCRQPETPLPEVGGEARYTMPAEHELHEATWLQWPHDATMGTGYRDLFDPLWVEMTRALHTGEMVYIVAHNASEKTHIENLLEQEGIDLARVQIFQHPTNDVWVRDNGPLFARDAQGSLVLQDWGFNGWGRDAPFELCDQVPGLLSQDLGIPGIDLNGIILEGGAIEHDGKGTMMATRSSVTHRSRNPRLTEAEIETYFSQYLGFSNFIWLDGKHGLDITDMHIDGLAKFLDDQTLVTMDESGLRSQGLSNKDIQTLYAAQNAKGEAYQLVYLPVTQGNVLTSEGQDLGFQGSYVNYYVGNEVILMPTYQDPSDAEAQTVLQGLYPDRQVVGIDCRDLLELGGMVHCVTQQQPMAR